MFVRLKTIKGRKYAYLVENEWTPWGSRQKVNKYLGKAHKPDKIKNNILELPDDKEKAIIEGIKQELLNHGFKENQRKYVYGTISVDLKNKTVKDGKKNAVIGMNEGFLCKETIQQLIEFEAEEQADKNAKKLATMALEAGMKLSQEQFVKMFELVQKTLKEQR